MTSCDLRYSRQLPFNWIGCNGTTLEKSVDNPNSNLARVVRYLKERGPSTKKNILIDVFRFEEREFQPSARFRREPRGWGSTLFSLAVHCGFLTHSRKGRTVIWDLGPIADRVKIR